MIQYQILQTKITRTIWQTVRRITNEIMGVKGLMKLKQILKRRQISEKLFKKQFLLCLSVNGIFSHFSGENETSSIANITSPLELTVPLKEILSKKKKKNTLNFYLIHSAYVQQSSLDGHLLV